MTTIEVLAALIGDTFLSILVGAGLTSLATRDLTRNAQRRATNLMPIVEQDTP